jgi:hypothetical protein
MRLKVVKQYGLFDEVVAASIQRHCDCAEHNHILEYSDSVKINDVVKEVAAEKVIKDYAPADINRLLQGTKWSANCVAFRQAGGRNIALKTIHNAGQKFLQKHFDSRMRGSRESWEVQLDDCHEFLQALGSDMLSEKLVVEKGGKEVEKGGKGGSNKSFGIAFAKRGQRYHQFEGVIMSEERCFVSDFLTEHIRTLIRRGHLILLDVTHNTNILQWKLFTIMVRFEHDQWISAAHLLASNEDGDIVGAFLRQVKQWVRAWRCRYVITDDSAAEQRAVRMSFRGLEAGEQEVSHYLCRTHSERTLKRKLAGFRCKKVYENLYTALYYRRTGTGCFG